MAHPCNWYCVGTVHCLQAIMDPSIVAPTADAVLAWLKADIEAALRGSLVLRVQPAPEADVEDWKATSEWLSGDTPEPRHTDAWLVFVDIPSWPQAPVA